MSEDKTKDVKHVCDSICEEFGCTDDAEKNHELESNNRQVKKILEHCSLFKELMELEVSLGAVKEKLVRLIFEESRGVCEAFHVEGKIKNKMTKEVLHFMKEIDFIENEVY